MKLIQNSSVQFLNKKGQQNHCTQGVVTAPNYVGCYCNISSTSIRLFHPRWLSKLILFTFNKVAVK